MPLPLILGGLALLGVGALVVAFWDEIKQFAIDLATSLYRTAKRSKNALKMIAKGFAEDDIFEGDFRLMKKGGKFILETFVYEFQQTPSWKLWKKDELEVKTTYRESKTIDAKEVPDEIKEKLEQESEIRDTLELKL